MSEISELFPTKESFDAYWDEHYVPVCYADVRKQYEEYVLSVDKHIFLSDYEENGCINESDFMNQLSQDAEFYFQDTLTEVFYDKNPEIYENAFALYESSQLEEKPEMNTAVIFQEEYHRLYQEFLLAMFQTLFA